MNDFQEIEYGLAALIPAWKKPELGGRLKALLDSLHDGISVELEQRFDSWLTHFRWDTYLTCLSEHTTAEDALGRLSMWRAYGGRDGVALIIKRYPFESETNTLKAYSSAVAYLTVDEFHFEFGEMVDRATQGRDLLSRFPRETLFATVFQMLRFSILATKHPAFKEECEWRIIYSPTFEPSPVIERTREVVRGVPQDVHKIPLINDPARGLNNAEISSLLDRLIIGPSAHLILLFKTFAGLLQEHGVQNAAEKISLTQIPLRAV